MARGFCVVLIAARVARIAVGIVGGIGVIVRIVAGIVRRIVGAFLTLVAGVVLAHDIHLILRTDPAYPGVRYPQ